MKLILTTTSSNDNYSGGCDYAFLNLDKDLAQQALGRIDMLKAAHQKDNSLCYMHFWDYSPVWFSPWPDDNGRGGQTVEQTALLGELVEGLLPSDYVTVAEDMVIPDAYDARTECNVMVVSQQNVYWECYPKHSDFTVASASLPIEVLREALDTTSKSVR